MIWEEIVVEKFHGTHETRKEQSVQIMPGYLFLILNKIENCCQTNFTKIE